MSRLTAADRKALPLSDFAVPSKAPGPGSYPINDKSHAAAAKGFSKRFGSQAVQSAVKKKASKFVKPMHSRLASAMEKA